MSEQLSFPLPVRPAMERENFFVSQANADALAMVEASEDWPERKLIVFGPAGAGKTHLAHVWAHQVSAQILAWDEIEALDLGALEPRPIVVEDIEQLAGQSAAEESLFHLHNFLKSAGSPLMMTTLLAPGRLPISLPDLKSRVLAAGVTELLPPDDMLLQALLVKQFSDRQLNMPPGLLDYIIPRIERSFQAVQDFVKDIDRKSLAENRPIGQRLARDILTGSIGMGS